MRTLAIALFVLGLSLSSCSQKQEQESMEQLIDRVFTVAQDQCLEMEQKLDDKALPFTISKEGEFKTREAKWWASGFYPGTLWYIFEHTGSADIKNAALKNTIKMEPMQHNAGDHDVGFRMYCSYGNALRLTGEESFKDVLLTSTKTLATRYSPVVKSIKSWDFVREGKDWKFPVIIDNMMNLEMMIEVDKMFNQSEFTDMAIAHANTTLKHHFRDDYTCYHLVDYDPETGEVRTKETVQGFADESAWARGQAWAIYGFAMMYRLTNDKAYLTQTENIAKMLLKRLPEDGIPYWDFDSDKIPNDLRDASAGAIMASAFIEFAGQTEDKQLAQDCMGMAEKQLRTLASPEYLAAVGQNHNFLLMHSVGSIPHGGEVDAPLTYADYYFLEALLRYKKTLK